MRPTAMGTTKPATPLYAAAVAGPALLSFGLFRTLRFALGRIKRAYLARHPEGARQWQIFSREFVEKPLVVPLLLTSAPRWNPHAVIGSLGPFLVKDTISVDARDARTSGEWFFAVYSHPRHEAVGSLSHLNDGGEDWIELKVPKAGYYSIGARYYRPRSSITFPVVRADGLETTAAAVTTPEVNLFYANLWKRENALHRAMAYYMRVLLRCRNLVPDRWVFREFIPVGNPETRFAFGTCRQGERLLWDIEPDILDRFDIYLTLYSRGSFPRLWLEIDRASASGATIVPCDGFYLARIQQKSPPGAWALRPLADDSPSIEFASAGA